MQFSEVSMEKSLVHGAANKNQAFGRTACWSFWSLVSGFLFQNKKAANLFCLRISNLCLEHLNWLVKFRFFLRKFYYEFIERKGNCLFHEFYIGFGISSSYLEHVKATHVQLYTPRHRLFFFSTIKIHWRFFT